MDLLTFCGFAAVCCFGGIILKSVKPELIPAYSALTGCLLLSQCFGLISQTVKFLSEMASKSGVATWFDLLFKAVAAAIGCETCADLCRDCGESATASRVELAGRLYILLLSLPLMKQVLSLTEELLT